MFVRGKDQFLLLVVEIIVLTVMLAAGCAQRMINIGDDMGLFDFISGPSQPLDERFKRALHMQFQNNDGIINKLARVQERLAQEIPTEENIMLITYGEELYKDGFGIITDKRVMRFKKKVETQLLHSDVGEVKSLVYPKGYFSVEIWGNKAMPYKDFAPQQMSDKVLALVTNNWVSVSMEDQEVKNQFLVILDMARQMRS